MCYVCALALFVYARESRARISETVSIQMSASSTISSIAFYKLSLPSQSSYWICVDKGCVHVVSPIAYCILKLPSIVLGLLNFQSNKWSKQIIFAVARVDLKNQYRTVVAITARHASR